MKKHKNITSFGICLALGLASHAFSRFLRVMLDEPVLQSPLIELITLKDPTQRQAGTLQPPPPPLPVGPAPKIHPEPVSTQIGATNHQLMQTSGADVQARSNPYKYLPTGAKISDETKDVVFADLEGNGTKDEIIFYAVPDNHQAGIIVLKPSAVDHVPVWQIKYDSSWGFYPDLTGVYDLNKSGRPQIFAFHGIGASCPGQLRIYQSKRGKIEDISGPWADPNGCDWPEIKDMNGDGRSEIIIRTRNYGVNPHVYAWTGKRYVESDAAFPQFYNDQLMQLIGSIYSREVLPANARVMWLRQAVEIYLLQRHNAEAVALCNGVLRVIDDPNLTNPNSIVKGQIEPELNRITTTFEIEKIDGKATVHRLLGDTYNATGNSQQAQEHYGEAKKLEDQAKELKSKLPPIKLVPAN